MSEEEGKKKTVKKNVTKVKKESKTSAAGGGGGKKKERNIEDEKRTIFVGNLSKDCKKEDLIKLFKKFGKIETVRFRNVVPEDLTKPKKFAFITKQIHPNKTTVNAFVRFKDEGSAEKAKEETNGVEFKSLHLRVDLATNSKEHDNKRSVFIGGLPFDVSDEDIYKHFDDCGSIEFVRVIRDNKTGIGKGFGYVQFKSNDAVPLALRLNGSSLNEREIRVMRCVKKQKVNKKNEVGGKKGGGKAQDTRNQSSQRGFPKKGQQSQGEKPKFRKDFKKKPFVGDAAKQGKTSKKEKHFKKKPRHISTNQKANLKLKI